MKFGSKLQFECPDECPKNCALRPEYFYQGCTCTRCPIFSCADNPDIGPLVEPEDYRDDWAKEWELFFKTGEYPKLRL